MRKKLWIVILIFCLLIICGMFLWMNAVKVLPVKRTVADTGVAFSIVEDGDTYLRVAKKGTPVGRTVPTALLTDSVGEDVLVSGKKALVTFARISHKKYFPLIREWARMYRNQLTVILVTDGTLSGEERSCLLDAGVRLVLDSAEVRGHLDPGPLQYSFMIDENLRIVYRFTFAEYHWREMVRDMDLFARQSIVPSPAEQPATELGEPLTLAMTLAGGKSFNLNDFLGKPSIFFLLNPADIICNRLYPLIRSLQSEYWDILNIGIVFTVYNYQTDQLVREFYDRYGLSAENMENHYVENMQRFTTQNDLHDLKVFFDQNHQIFHENLIWMTPTVMIMDEELVLRAIFGIGGDGEPDGPDFYHRIAERIDEVL